MQREADMDSLKGSDTSSGVYSDRTEVRKRPGGSIEGSDLTKSHHRTYNHPISQLERQDSVEFFDTQSEVPGSVGGSPGASPEAARRSKDSGKLSLSSHDSSQLSLSASLPAGKLGVFKEKKEKRRNIFRRHKKDKSKKGVMDSGSIRSSSSLVVPEAEHIIKSKSLPGGESDHSSIMEGYDSDQLELIERLVHPTPSPSFGNRPYTPTDSPREDSPVQQWLVTITLHSGHELVIRDRTGSSDPYVKFKCGSFKHRSSTIHRNLNPEWNETFSFKTNTLHIPLTVRVFDHDFGSLDDFMGGATISLDSYADKNQHILDLGLVDPVATRRGETLGFIRCFLKILPQYRDESEDDRHGPTKGKHGNTQRSAQLWSSVLSVTLLEASSLTAMDDNGFSDPYCKFKLGSQKFKSKICAKTLNPQWKERFELRIYDDHPTVLHAEVWDRDLVHSDDFIGSCSIELESLLFDVTHDLTLRLKSSSGEEHGSLHVLLVLTSTKVQEDSISKTNMQLKQNTWKYRIHRSVDVKSIKDIGFLTVKIDRAEDLTGTETFAMIEVGNSVVRTQTVRKTNNPTWEKAFNFRVKDIHDELEVSVYNAVKSKGSKAELLGKIKVPLHNLELGVIVPYALKDKHCLQRARGVVHVECGLVYNAIRACVRTINPREDKLIEEEEKFRRKVLFNNVKRVANLVRTIISSWDFIKSLWSWESSFNSAASFVGFLILVIFGELWMLLLLGAGLFLYQYLVVYIKGRHYWQLKSKSGGMASMRTHYHSIEEHDEHSDTHSFSDFSELEDELEAGDSKEKVNLRQRLRQLQDILLIVQKVVGVIADMEERVRNLFNWSVPFLCWMSVGVLVLASFLFYFVPLRYVILVWGINKWTKRLRKPHYIDNTELLDFISRSPTNKQLEQWRPLPLHSSSSSSSSSRNHKHGKAKKKTR